VRSPVVLTTRHRSSIFQSLTPIIGEEEAEALLSQFPARDLDEPVTKEFVRAEISEVRAEIAGLRGEMHSEIARLEARINDRFREQTMWMAGAMTIGMGLAAGIGTLLG
jgi:hypothetical protein